MSNTKTVAAAVIVVIVVLAIGAFLLLGRSPSPSVTQTTSSMPAQTTQSSSYSGQVPIAITDPAQVPAGTRALVVTYSSLQANESGPSGSGWVGASGSGTVNLTSTVGSGQVIGYMKASAATTISAVEMTVTSAYIVVNGTAYNVTVPGQTITAQVAGQAAVDQNATVVVEVTPTVAAVYAHNTTAFVMAPSAKAVVVAGTGASADTGSVFSLNADVDASLSAATPSITITSANVSVSGNVTTIAVTVKDTSNATVSIENVVLDGQQDVTASTASGADASVAGDLNEILGGAGSSIGLNASASTALQVGANLHAFQQAVFAASSSGELSQVSSAANISNSGIDLSPGSSATLTYSGQATYDSGLYTTAVVSGSSYSLAVGGQDGATASTTVTAT